VKLLKNRIDEIKENPEEKKEIIIEENDNKIEQESTKEKIKAKNQVNFKEKDDNLTQTSHKSKSNEEKSKENIFIFYKRIDSKHKK